MVDAESDTMTTRNLANVFGMVGIFDVDAGGWRWETDGRRDPRNQKVAEMFLVQVTYAGKGWCWAHRTRKEATAMAENMRGLGVKNVRIFRGAIEWEPV